MSNKSVDTKYKRSTRKYFKDLLPILKFRIERSDGKITRNVRIEMLETLDYSPEPIPIHHLLEIISSGEDSTICDELVNVARVFCSLKNELKKEDTCAETLMVIIEDLEEHYKKL